MTDPQRERALVVLNKFEADNRHKTLDDAKIKELLADLLLDFARKEREDEAQWWAYLGWPEFEDSPEIAKQRLAQLQPQPAKKGTGT